MISRKKQPGSVEGKTLPRGGMHPKPFPRGEGGKKSARKS